MREQVEMISCSVMHKSGKSNSKGPKCNRWKVKAAILMQVECTTELGVKSGESAKGT